MIVRRIQWLAFLASLVCPWLANAQIDPEPRKIVQLGYNQSFEGRGPLAAYAYLYWNIPDFPHTNRTLRLAIAPTYVDSEFGFRHCLSEQTDVAVGLAGGGFADSFSEIRGGQYLRSESFTGHGGEGSMSLYHLVNPHQQIPLNLILRGIVRYSAFVRDGETDPAFQLPDNRTTLALRAGVRWGGREPLLITKLAMEISAWYEGQYRNDYGPYGFSGDRAINSDSHLFWGRALLNYTFPEAGHQFSASMTAGTSVNSDRFSAYRLGAILPMASEFPLTLPGYYYQEISAQRFLLFSGQYLLPLDSRKAWSFTLFASTAVVNYLDGLEQPGNWHSGVGGGLTYQSPSGIWQINLGYARGIDAIRNHGRGANTVGVAVQFDLDRDMKQGGFFDPAKLRDRLRGLEGIFRR